MNGFLRGFFPFVGSVESPIDPTSDEPEYVRVIAHRWLPEWLIGYVADGSWASLERYRRIEIWRPSKDSLSRKRWVVLYERVKG